MKTKVALLCGGISSEDYLSRRSCGLIYSELGSDKFDIYVLDWHQDGSVIETKRNTINQPIRTHKDIVCCFADFRGDIVVNLLHGEKENCGEIQGLLELAGIPYTGNDITSSVVGMNKILTKRCFETLGIRTAADFLFQPRWEEDKERLLSEFKDTPLEFPLMLKPVKGGSSFGIQLANNENELIEFISTQHDGSPYFFEEFIEGDDYSIGVFATHTSTDPIVLPTAFINYQGDFFDASIKYDDTYRVDFPTDIDPDLVQLMRDAAVKTHQHIGFNGFSRCDFIIKDDEVYALEVNTHPGMSSFSIVPNMVKHANLSLGSLFEQMIEESLSAA